MIFSPETIPVCQLRDPRPLIFYTDATFDGLRDYHADYTNLCRPSLRAGHAVYQAALSRSTLAVFTSEWRSTRHSALTRSIPRSCESFPAGPTCQALCQESR